MTIDQFTKSNTPISFLVNFSNPVGIKLAQILIEQGSKVVLVDTYTQANKKIIAELIKDNKAIFMDIESTLRNLEKFQKIDYIYYFLNGQVNSSFYPLPVAPKHEPLSHKEFTRETNRVDTYIKLGVEYKAKFVLVTSAILSQFIELPGEQNIQLQKYAESLLQEYYTKTKFNGRVVRLAEVLGEKQDMSIATNITRLIRELFFEKDVLIFGEGLQSNYFVNYLDAVYGLLKINFSDKTKGKTYLLAEKSPISTLSLAYKLLELTPDDKEVAFREVTEDMPEVEKLRDLCLATPAQEIGWEPVISIDQSLRDTLQSVAQYHKSEWKLLTKPSENVTELSKPVVQATEQEPITKKEEKPKVVTRSVEPRENHIKNGLLSAVSQVGQSISTVSNKTTATFSGERIRNGASFVGYVLLVLVIGAIIAPYINVSINAYQVYSSAKVLETDLKGLNTKELESHATKFSSDVSNLKSSLDWISYWKYVPGVNDTFTETTKLLTAASYYSESIKVGSKAAVPIVDYIKDFKVGKINNPAGETPIDYSTYLSKIVEQKSSVAAASQNAALGKQVLDTVNMDKFPGFIKDQLVKTKVSIDTYTGLIQALPQAYDYVPFLTGYKNRTNYLLMVQNETEIRSTGGWFTNYALIGMENGRIRELTVDDVYNIDGQVKEKKAPTDMQKGIDLNSYKFSLSNWSPDIEQTSKEAESFLKEAGKAQNVDVFVTVNFSFVRDLLKLTGPIDVEGYGQVTAENLFDKVVQLHTTFTPGSQQKVGIVSTLMPKLLDKLVALDMQGKTELMRTVQRSIAERHVMIYSKNASLNSIIFEQNNTYLKMTNLKNGIAVIDWNWSGNKTNKYVVRETRIDLDEAAKSLRLAVVYKNMSRSEAYPEGIYKDFQRIYYPIGWKILETSGYSALPDTYAFSKDISYSGKLITVPVQTTKVVSLVFGNVDLQQQLLIAKQSGIDSELVTITLKQSQNSAFKTDTLKALGFTQSGSTWTKSQLRTQDINLTLQ